MAVVRWHPPVAGPGYQHTLSRLVRWQWAGDRGFGVPTGAREGEEAPSRGGEPRRAGLAIGRGVAARPPHHRAGGTAAQGAHGPPLPSASMTWTSGRLTPGRGCRGGVTADPRRVVRLPSWRADLATHRGCRLTAAAGQRRVHGRRAAAAAAQGGCRRRGSACICSKHGAAGSAASVLGVCGLARASPRRWQGGGGSGGAAATPGERRVAGGRGGWSYAAAPSTPPPRGSGAASARVWRARASPSPACRRGERPRWRADPHVSGMACLPSGTPNGVCARPPRWAGTGGWPAHGRRSATAADKGAGARRGGPDKAASRPRLRLCPPLYGVPSLVASSHHPATCRASISLAAHGGRRGAGPCWDAPAPPPPPLLRAFRHRMATTDAGQPAFSPSPSIMEGGRGARAAAAPPASRG